MTTLYDNYLTGHRIVREQDEYVIYDRAGNAIDKAHDFQEAYALVMKYEKNGRTDAQISYKDKL